MPGTQYVVGLNKLCRMNKQINGDPKEGRERRKGGREGMGVAGREGRE